MSDLHDIDDNIKRIFSDVIIADENPFNIEEILIEKIEGSIVKKTQNKEVVLNKLKYKNTLFDSIIDSIIDKSTIKKVNFELLPFGILKNKKALSELIKTNINKECSICFNFNKLPFLKSKLYNNAIIDITKENYIIISNKPRLYIKKCDGYYINLDYSKIMVIKLV